MKNIKLKPFCVRSSDLTDEELNQVLEKCLELGAYEYEWVKGFDKRDDDKTCKRCHFKYWGVDVDFDTYTSDLADNYEGNFLSKEDTFKMLGLNDTVGQQREEKESKNEDTVLGLLQASNLSLTMNKEGITITDEETGTSYKIPNEEDIIDFIEKLKAIKEYTKN